MSAGTLISRVGPKGYIHGWIFVGAPGAGDQVFHPHHGHGTVTEAHSGHVRVRFESGDHRDFPVRADKGPGHFERMTDEELANELSAGEGHRFHHAVAELDRRDRAERDAKVKSLYAEKPKVEADRNRVYQGLVDAGENPEDAWSHAHGVDTEQMQRQAVIAQLRSQGYKGGGFDALARDAFKHDVQRRVLDAETATNGYMLSRDGEKAGIDPWSLFTGPEARARKYASSELREWWDQNGRPTAADFQSTLMGHAAAAGGPHGGDFYRSATPAGEAQRSAAAAMPGRVQVLAKARTEGHRAGRAYRDNGTMPEQPGDFTSGPLLVRQAASEWHRGFEDGRGAPAPVSRAETTPGDVRSISRVGPKGYIHGWIFVGAPGAGDKVTHPLHGRGTVTSVTGGHVSVRFDRSGQEHSFEHKPPVLGQHIAPGFRARRDAPSSTAGARAAEYAKGLAGKLHPKALDEYNRGQYKRERLDPAFHYSDAQLNAIEAYTEAGYESINGGLRSTGKLTEQSKALHSAMQPLPDDLTLIREVNGAGALAHAKRGDVLTDAGFSSTALTASSGHFGGGRSDTTVMHIMAPAGTPAVWTGGVSSFHEDEVILDHGTPMAVIKSGPRPGRSNVTDVYLLALPKGLAS